MDTITTMIIAPMTAALVPSADLGGATGVFIDRGRAAVEPKAPFVVDPRPAGPSV